MVFALNGTSKSVSAKEYTRQAPGDAKTCVVLLQDVSTAHGQFGSLLLPPIYGMNNYWVLGSSFLRGSCHALDFGNTFFENLPDFPALFGFAPAA
ncbi:hypothetical protein AAVH_16703 [Aphelenchoides avenae]|nr:hypothetical protein AAVH_16703 [Aphelenchus avenae]